MPGRCSTRSIICSAARSATRSRISAGFGGAQSYPSRTKDQIPVDFSTGSVGLGVAITLFASLVQDYLTAHGWMDEKDRGPLRRADRRCRARRRQYLRSPDRGLQARHPQLAGGSSTTTARASTRPAPTACSSASTRFSGAAAGGSSSCATARSCRRRSPSIRALEELVREAVRTPSFRRLHYQGGAAWRDAASRRTSAKRRTHSSRSMTTTALAALLTNLGGHCMETLVEAFDAAQDDVPTLFIAWTIKGFGLPFAGHKDNHAGLMNPTQIAALREAMGVREGQEWEPLDGVGDNARPGVEALIERSAHRAREARRAASAASRSRPFPPRPARSNRPRPRSAASCSTSPRPAATSPTGSSPPRPTSPSRPTLAPG